MPRADAICASVLPSTDTPSCSISCSILPSSGPSPTISSHASGAERSTAGQASSNGPAFPSGPLAGFVLLGVWLCTYRFMYYDTLLAAAGCAPVIVGYAVLCGSCHLTIPQRTVSRPWASKAILAFRAELRLWVSVRKHSRRLAVHFTGARSSRLACSRAAYSCTSISEASLLAP